MKTFKLVSDEKSNASYRVNTLRTTRNVLTQIFGEPEEVESFDNKITVRWTIAIEDLVIVTLYDYKRYELGTPGLNEVYDWHVGGFSDEAYDELLSVVLEQFNEIVKKKAEEEDE